MLHRNGDDSYLPLLNGDCLVACQQASEELAQFGILNRAVLSDEQLGEEALVEHPSFARFCLCVLLVVEFDYSAVNVAHVSVLDLIASAKRSQILRLPEAVPGKSVTVDFDGWVFPRTGFAFVWTLDSEVQHAEVAAGDQQALDAAA